MPVAVIVGAQWGDEGKGKVVDLYAQYADVVVRYGGGANAGHTLVVDGAKTVLHLIPSGVLRADKRCVLGPGMVIDPAVLVDELVALDKAGIATAGRVLVSERAHMVLAHHKLADALREQSRARPIGTTRRGIGPCYESKAGRRGVRMGDLTRPEILRSKIEADLDAWRPTLEALGGSAPSAKQVVDEVARHAAQLASHVVDASRPLAEALHAGRNVLLEGAQGTMLDVDHGTYPFVTSSSVVAGGACAGAGIGPSAVRRVIGITKAYATRVGEGPFPSELDDATGERLRKVGGEYGATTGRPRRCGWLDIPALRYAARINGLDEITITKLDVLSGLETIQVCVGYECDGKQLDAPPYEDWDRVRPVWRSFPGWTDDLSACRSIEDLPAPARSYLRAIAELSGCAIGLVSVGPDRRNVFGLVDPFRA